MGRSTTPAYRIEVKSNMSLSNFGYGPAERKYFGKPSFQSLKLYVDCLNNSFEEGGTNYHVSDSDKVCKIYSAIMVKQSNNETVAEYQPVITMEQVEEKPVFEVWEG